MDMEYARSRLYGFLEDLAFWASQYTLLGIACLLGGIQSVLGALSTMARDKSEQIREIRGNKEDDEVISTTESAARIPEGSSEVIETVAQEEAVSVGESGETVEDCSEEPDGLEFDEEDPPQEEVPLPV